MSPDNKEESKNHKIPTIAIVGRPNVGKSSLFNVILGRRLSIVHEESGVTRDRIMAPVVFHGRHFQIVDTGGLGNYSGEKRKVGVWDMAIRQQVDAAIEGADILFMVTDIQDGLTPLDEEIADKLRGSGKPVLLVVNKVDNRAQDLQSSEFAALGFDEMFQVSCMHRQGIDDLLDATLVDIEPMEDLETAPEVFKIAIIGRPNVGKSSMVNFLLGEKRVMVSDVAGTTRDSVDVAFELEYKGEKRPATLVDTAGLRKRSKVDTLVERFSVMRAESAVKRADLVLFVVEAKPEGLTAQDRRIAGMISESGKGCIIVANKWDICEGHKQKHVLNEIRYTLPRMDYAPVVFTCALSGLNVGLLLDTIAEVMGQMEVQVPTSMVNRVIEDATTRNSPPIVGKQPFKIFYGTMVKNVPPTFVLFVNNPDLCAPNYMGYLNNCFRRNFDLLGLPIRIEFRARPKREFVPSASSSKPKKRVSQARLANRKYKSKKRR